MLGVAPDIDAYLQRLRTGLDPVDRAEVGRPTEMIHQARKSGRFVFIFGNGGSGCLIHWVVDDVFPRVNGAGRHRE